LYEVVKVARFKDLYAKSGLRKLFVLLEWFLANRIEQTMEEGGDGWFTRKGVLVFWFL